MLNCTEITIKRIEEGTTKISDYIIGQINKIFDINIYEYYGIISQYNSYSAYIKCKNLKTAIDLHDDVLISKCVVDYEDLTDFKKGEPFLLLYYAKILTCTDLQHSINLCYYSLSVTNFNETLALISNIKLNNNCYSILIALTVKLEQYDDLDNAFLLSEKLYLHFNDIIFDNDIRLEKYNFDTQKKYITIINNYAHFNFVKSNYEKTLLLVEEGLSQCLYFNTLHALEYLYLLKMEASYMLGNISESFEYKNFFVMLCQTKHNYSLLSKINNKIKISYPKLLY